MRETTKILYIEDDEANRELVGFILEGAGNYTLLEAGNGQDGIQIASEEKPDLILLDLTLPDLNGNEVFNRLKASEASCTIPVIALTGNYSTHDRTTAREKGFFDYLPKPVDIDALCEAIEKAVDLSPESP